MSSSATLAPPVAPVRPEPNQPRPVPLAAMLALSILALIPCFWQRTIQAGDLGSHIYNSWLTQQIDLGKAPGLVIAPMTTNVLFDLILGALYRSIGAGPAQRIAVSAAVLIFFWGAFALVSTASATRPWFLTPCLLMLTYGWTFHMGFFNYYLASGLSLWAVTLALRFGARGLVGSGLLLALAYTGNALPPLLAAGMMAYSWIARKLDWRLRFVLLGAAFAAILVLRYWITHRYSATFTFHRFLEASAIDQVWVFGLKYWALSLCLALLWGFLLLRITNIEGMFGTLCNAYFQMCVLMAAGAILLPSSIEMPQYRIAVSFISERVTLLYGVLICAFLARADPPQWLRRAFIPLAVVYFSLIFVDTDAINRVEKRMETLTAGLSAQDRVFTSFEDPLSRVQLWGHNLDRVCVGRCISYANYEPFTRQFRVRALRQNPLVVADPLDFAAFAAGGYVVKQSDLPLSQITLCSPGSQELCLVRLNPGDVTRHDLLSVTPAWW